jgi:hypothetical protein
LSFVFHFTLQKSSFPRQRIAHFGNIPATAPLIWQQPGHNTLVSATPRQQTPDSGNNAAKPGN